MTAAQKADKATLAFRCCDLSAHDDVEALQQMVGRGREIAFDTFSRHVDWKPLAESMGYATEPGQPGMRLQDDRLVEFCSGKWKGEPVYYMVHSAIEYVFRAQKAKQTLRPADPWGGMSAGNTAAAAPKHKRRAPRP